MTLEATFLASAADKLNENLGRIATCLADLPPDVLWARNSENENAVGNLLLHLEGNVRQWVLSGIGESPMDATVLASSRRARAKRRRCSLRS